MQPSIIPTTARVQRRSPDRGLIGPLGIAILLAITVIGSVAVVTVGATALNDTRETSQLERVEHAMTQFDSRHAVVGLGEADVQSVALGSSSGGRYTVVPDAGWIRVVHHDYDRDGSNETVLNRTLGGLVYRAGDTTIAHEGGGVWRKDGEASVMVSPPEFHYQRETLVLPIVSVQGQDSVGGPARATVRRVGEMNRVFPADGSVGTVGSGAPYDATDDQYRNPIQGGTVIITVQSEYYVAWGRYLETRTEGSVTYDHSRQTTSVELIAPRTLGNFDMPAEGNAIDIRGIPDGHAVDAFTVDLAPDDSDAANFNNLQWSMYAKEGNEEFEIHLRLTNAADDPATSCKEQNIAAAIYYSETNGNPYHGWHDDTAFVTECVDRDGDGQEDEIRLVANLTGDTPLTYMNLTSSHLNHFNPSGASLAANATFDEHSSDVAWEPVRFVPGDSAPIGHLIDHYLGLLGPDYDLVVDDKNSDTVSEDDSTGFLLYEGEGRVTFMHITGNQVHVELTGGDR